MLLVKDMLHIGGKNETMKRISIGCNQSLFSSNRLGRGWHLDEYKNEKHFQCDCRMFAQNNALPSTKNMKKKVFLNVIFFNRSLKTTKAW